MSTRSFTSSSDGLEYMSVIEVRAEDEDVELLEELGDDDVIEIIAATAA